MLNDFLKRFQDGQRDVWRENVSIVASRACLWEAAARKVGNVHPGCSFDDTSFIDFASSAHVLGDQLCGPVGRGVYRIVSATNATIGRNTNLGIALLITPLYASTPGLIMAATPRYGATYPHREKIGPALAALTVEDARLVYHAIRLARPGGLGTVPDQDASDEPTVTLLEAMALAADRDLIARQYVNNFADVFDLGVPALLDGYQRHGCVEAAAIHCHLAWMAAFPDSLIARKNGLAVAVDVQDRVKHMMSLGGIDTPEGRAAGVALDAHLRSDGNKLNPGTSADLVAACLFVALREGKIPLNAPFPWKVDDWL